MISLNKFDAQTFPPQDPRPDEWSGKSPFRDLDNTLSTAQIPGPEANTSANSAKAATASATDAHVKAGDLPAVTVEGSTAADTGNHNWWSGVMTVANDVGKGVADEIFHHPLHLVENAAIGLGVGLAAEAVAPAVATAAFIAGGAYAGYQLYNHIGGWVHDAGVVAAPQDYSAAAKATAHAELQGLGAGMADFGAALQGNLMSGAVRGVISGAIDAFSADAAAPTVTSALSDVQPPAAVAAPDIQPPPIASTPDVQTPAATSTPDVQAPAASSDVQAQPRDLLSLPSKNPFRAEQTTMTISDSGNWPLVVSGMGGTRYGAPILRFANDWATKMEQMMNEGQPLSADVSREAAIAAAPPGFSGIAYGKARTSLYSSWKYGPQLKAILAPGWPDHTLTDPE